MGHPLARAGFVHLVLAAWLFAVRNPSGGLLSSRGGLSITPFRRRASRIVVPRELPRSTNGGELAIFLGFSAYLFSGDGMRIDMVGVVTLILVFLAWLVFAAIFVFRKKPPKAEETKRVAAAKWGIALQGVGFALVGSFHRAQWWPLPRTLFGEVIFAAATVALAYSSCLFCLRAVRTLGNSGRTKRALFKGTN